MSSSFDSPKEFGHTCCSGGGGGKDDIGNIVTACRACSSLVAGMKFDPGTNRDQAFRDKRNHIREHQIDYFEFWKENVLPKMLDFWRK